MRPSAVLLVLPLLLLAGCSSPAPSPPASGEPPASGPGATMPDPGSASPATPPDAPETLSFAGCRQFHTAFPAQASDLQPLLPDGFTVETDEAGLATLMVLPTDCAEGPHGPAAWLLVEVAAVPPPQWADPQASHAVAIEAYVGEGALLSWLQGKGFALAEPCACAATTGPGGAPFTDGFASDGAEDHYAMHTALTPDSGPFAGHRSYAYVARDGHAVARLLETAAESTNRGFGSVVLQYSGPGAAPSVFPGEVAHEVEGLALTWTVEPLA